MKEMNIVFLSSNEFAPHMSVTMSSILLNNKDYHINFFVLTKFISDITQEKLSSLESQYSCNITYCYVNDNIFKGINPDFHYNSIETYYRLVVADLITDKEKCILIDVDTIVNGSLKDFWEMDISNEYCAAVKDLYAYNIKNYLNTIKYPKNGVYFNAGVMLMNLKKMRKDKIVPQLLAKALEIHTIVKFLDQDILNLVFKDKVKIVDSIYNYTTSNLEKEPEKKNSWVIRHFNGPVKPWHNINNMYDDFYLYFYYKNFSPIQSNIKIFEVYHKDAPLFSTHILTPIKTGFETLKCKTLQDNTENNISNKNVHYAELTGNYWVWRNYLPKYPELEYVGFCHYRRFLDFENAPQTNRTFTKFMSFSKFEEIFSEKYITDKVYPIVKDYDVILPELHTLDEKNIYQQFIDNHPQKDIDLLIEIIKSDYPDMADEMNDFLFKGNQGYFCLNFVMKKELFESWMTWIFDVLSKLEKQTNWKEYTDYLNQKTPAYLAERFFNVWLRHQQKTKHIKILERGGIILYNPEKPEKQKIKIFPGITLKKDGDKRTLKIFGIKITAQKIKTFDSKILIVGPFKFYKYKKLYLKLMENYYNKIPIKLVATLLVRDEIDILEDNIKFHLSMGVDFIIATDNGSVDGSRDVLLKYQEKGVLKLIDEPSHDYNQVAWVDKMIKIAKKEYKADWIINLDADEFWYSAKGDLKRDLMLLDKFNVIYIPSLFMYPNKETSSDTPFYDATKGLFKNLMKCIHRTKGYKKIEMGSHDVEIKKKKPTFYTGISLFHYFMRSYEQFENKVKISGEALLKNKNLKKDQGTHALELYKKYLDGELRKEYNKRIKVINEESITNNNARFV